MLSIIKKILASLVLVLIGIFLASNYEVRVLDISDENKVIVKAGEMFGTVAYDFKFINKHVVIMKK